MRSINDTVMLFPVLHCHPLLKVGQKSTDSLVTAEIARQKFFMLTALHLHLAN